MSKGIRTRGVLVACVALLSISSPIKANNDFGLDFRAEGNKKLLLNRLTLGLGLEARTQDNTSQMERYVIEAGGSYKLIDKKKFDLKVGLSYEHMWMKNLSEQVETYKLKYYDDKFNYLGGGQFEAIEKGYNKGYNYDQAYWRNRSRWNLSVAVSCKPFRRFTLTLKETMQYNYFWGTSTTRTKYREKYRYGEPTTSTTEILEKTKYSKVRWMLRSKLTLQYSKKKCPWEPYVAVDYGKGIGNTDYKWKFIGGTDFKISKQHTLNAFYRFQKENDEDEPNGHIVGIGYNFKF